MNLRDEVRGVLDEYERLARQVVDAQSVVVTWARHEDELGEVERGRLIEMMGAASDQEERVWEAETSYLRRLRELVVRWETDVESEDGIGEGGVRGLLEGARDRLEDDYYGIRLDSVEWIEKRDGWVSDADQTSRSTKILGDDPTDEEIEAMMRLEGLL